MKKKLSAGLVLALVLILLAAVALAVTLLTHKEIVEQVAVPLALENDAETVGVNDFYSAEELAEIVRVLNENGITFDENDRIIQQLQNGQGVFEESVISAICNKAFGNTWTPEQQDWFDELMYKIGYQETHIPCVPGEGNMTCEEAEAFAFAKLREVYGHDLSLEDRNIWRLSFYFQKSGQDSPEDQWVFWLRPNDLEHGEYHIYFNDRNPKESAETWAEVPEWNNPYTGDDLMQAFWRAYPGQWSQSVWQQLHEMMLNAELDPDSHSSYYDYLGYQLTCYPEPGRSDIPREEAIRIAKEALKLDRAAFDTAVLTEYDGQRSWLVALVIYEPDDDSEDEEAGKYVIEIDSASGTVRSQRKAVEFEDTYSFPYVPEAAYEKVREGLLRRSRLIPLAAEAVRKTYPWIRNPLDKSQYSVELFPADAQYIRFETRNPRHGGVAVWFNPDGTVDSVARSADPMYAEDMLYRYREAYGPINDWDQAKWAQLDQDMRRMDTASFNDMVLKATHYPEESTVTIQHRQAQELGIAASEKRTAQVDMCILVDAQPHPVWLMQIISDVATTMTGVDAETGEIVFILPYHHEFSPDYVLYSLPETWKRMEMEIKGAPFVAKAAIIYQYTDPHEWPADYNSMEAGFNWDLEVDGLTVRYTGRWKGMKSYEVELDEKGNVLRCEETESEATEERPKEEIWEQPWIWKNSAAPDTYWKQLETVLAKNEVDADFGNLPNKLVEWTEQYGAFSRETWPSDLYAIGYVLTKIRPSDLAAGTATFPEISETK